MSTEDDRRASVLGAMGRYFNRVESSKSFRKRQEEKRKHATKKKKPSNRGCPSEYQEHSQLVQVLRRTSARFLHPNNNARSAVAARRAKAMGMVRGASDLIIFTSPPSRPDRKGVCLEIKALDGKATKDQVAWLQGMHQEGFLCYVVWGCDAGVDLLSSLGYLEEFKHDYADSNERRASIPSKKIKGEPCYQEIQSVPQKRGNHSGYSRPENGHE